MIPGLVLVAVSAAVCVGGVVAAIRRHRQERRR